MAGDPEGFDDAAADADGDPRVILALNLVLSSLFAWAVVWGLSMIDVLEFTPLNVATLAVVLVGVTYLITLR